LNKSRGGSQQAVEICTCILRKYDPIESREAKTLKIYLKGAWSSEGIFGKGRIRLSKSLSRW
jgi:hypothetical protein